MRPEDTAELNHAELGLLINRSREIKPCVVLSHDRFVASLLGWQWKANTC